MTLLQQLLPLPLPFASSVDRSDTAYTTMSSSVSLRRLIQAVFLLTPPAKFVPAATHFIGGAMVTKLNITSPEIIGEAIAITGGSLLPLLHELPGIKDVPGAYELVVYAGQLAYAEAYKYVYYVSIAFGGVSIIAACFLGDISKYMDDHVAVVMH